MREKSLFFPYGKWRALLPLTLLFIFQFLSGYAQKIEIKPGNTRIAQNEFFTITLSIQNGTLSDFGNFPNIPGFSKAGTSSSSSMQMMNGRTTQEYSIIQNYMPEKQGTFTLLPFQMKVNGQTIKSPGTSIYVGPPANRSGKSSNPFSFDPFEDFLGKSQDYGDVKADAFFSIQSDKKEIWAGEGFTITISFLVSDDNQADLSFYDVGNQLTNILKQVKPLNCWEENFGIDEIEQRRLKIGKKSYTEYRIYQGGIFPITPGKIEIPALKLNMLLQTGSYFGRPKEEIRAFTSRPLRILVKDLPEHPLKGKVSVGKFKLVEKVGSRTISINQGTAYEFGIQGEGNISYIQEPIQGKSSLMDVYPPNSSQTIQRAGGRITGTRVFSYLVVPREIGSIPLSGSLFWVFFNTQTAAYDTLNPKTILKVVEGKKTSGKDAASSEDSFFSLLEKVDSRPVDLTERKSGNLLWYNLALGLMGVLSLAFMFRKR